jgi:drug/metabolite transporter (DMT)-like permease
MPSSSHSSDTGGHQLPPATALLAAFLCSLFGANPVALKVSLVGIGVFTAAGLRFGIAAVVLLSWAARTGIPLAVSRKQAAQLALLGVIIFTQISCFYYGQSKTSASHGVLIGNLLPFVVMVMAHFLLPNDRINPRKVIGLVLGFSGVLLLFVDRSTMAAHTLQGDLIILAGVVFWGCNVVYVKRITAGFHPIQITVYPMIFGVPLYLACGYFWDGGMIRALSPAIVGGLLYQSLLMDSFGLVMWNTLLQKYGASTLHAFMFIMPISGVSFSLLLLGEPLTANLLGAIALVTSGLLVINLGKRRTKATERS